MADAKKSTKAMRSSMRQLEIRTRRMVDDSMAGAYHSVFKGRGMDFDEVREYSPGDEVRTIDWNVTARAGRAFVKKFTEERELTLFLVVDISASGNFGSGAMAKRDLAAEVASVLAFSAIRNSDKVGLILYTDRVERYLPPKKGRRHVLRVVRDILYHEPQGIGTDTVKMLDVVNHVLHRRAVVFLISDFETSGEPDVARAQLRRAVRQTNRRHDLIAVHIEDPREKELPNVGIIALEDAETGELIELDTARATVRKALRQAVFGARAASQERSSGRRGRHRATADRYALHSSTAAILQISRPTTRMKVTARSRRTVQMWPWLVLLVRAALAEPSEDIRDIRGPKAVPGSWLLPALLAVAIVAALFAYSAGAGAVVQLADTISA